MMKKLLLFSLFFAFMLACSKAEIRNGLIGDWDYAYQIKEKNEDGSWGDWQTIQTYAFVPGVSFTADGRLLSGEETPTACCSFKKYTLKGDVIKLEDIVSCPTVDCAFCEEWKVISLEDDELVLQKCDIIQEKYIRAQ